MIYYYEQVAEQFYTVFFYLMSINARLFQIPQNPIEHEHRMYKKASDGHPDHENNLLLILVSSKLCSSGIYFGNLFVCQRS